MTDLDEESLTVVPLHQHPEFTQQCCELVNEEWQRSETARLQSLRTSCDKMPTCLILLTGDKKVIGHCKLTPIPSIKESCFIESVVIKNNLRGKGLGTFLMKASEEYCRAVLKLKMMHLSTKGQEKFYEKLGYDECEPVTIYGSFQQVQNTNVKTATTKPKIKTEENLNNFKPPIPPPININTSSCSEKVTKTYMKKSILL